MLPFFNRFARYLLLAGLLLAPLSPPAMARALPRHGAAPAAIAAPHPALWRLRFGASTIYLFGTVHLMSAEADWFAPPVARAFAA
ncbi:MAG TPA: TraB/GumN family protein, partial [Novosphingobium sp.]|nr:TraB/GumN family protein [Novosphingobium sp.]